MTKNLFGSAKKQHVPLLSDTKLFNLATFNVFKLFIIFYCLENHSNTPAVFIFSLFFRRLIHPMLQFIVLMQSACLLSMGGRPCTTNTSFCSSSTTSSSSSGVPTLLRPWARSLCRGLLPRITGPLRSLRIFPPSLSSPRWGGPSG